MTYEEVLSHFQVKKYGNGKAQALCPAHPDKEASLTITQMMQVFNKKLLPNLRFKEFFTILRSVVENEAVRKQ